MNTSKALEKAFNNWGRTRDIVTAFSDALEMLVCEFTPHWTDPETGRPRGRYTDKYLAVASRYKPEHICEYYPPILKAITESYIEGVTAEGGWCDPLGDYFQEIASSRDKSWKGQFFTPSSLCDMMAKFTKSKDDTRPSLSILDPACGSGRLSLAFDRNCPPGSNHFYIGVDIDARCIRIAALNFFFHGLRGVLICGNSLSLESRFGYQLHHPMLGRGIVHLDADECDEYMKQPAVKNAAPKLGQLSLFDM